LFWKPLIELDGIPLDTLQTVMDLLHDWKDSFLSHVGVSGGLKGDFIGAISACPLVSFSLFLRGSLFGQAQVMRLIM
jgi:hypothetical protein